jgi:hypothetical protein
VTFRYRIDGDTIMFEPEIPDGCSTFEPVERCGRQPGPEVETRELIRRALRWAR